ncbi:MAG: CRISPR-associated helicase Cas3' [Desulfatiglans sp.]|mgnify:CR=1 FL=1|nr:CRISPR-associated helicase Cas3' [Desulfatiglans sp.]
MGSKYYAHSENKNNEKHDLEKHLHETANLAESFACRTEYRHLFYLAGLIHDLGKYQKAFQLYLEHGGHKGSVPHASWGAGYARLNSLLETSIAVDGHHKGLPNISLWKSDTEPFKRGEVNNFEDVFKIFKTENNIEEAIISNRPLTWQEHSEREFFIRYLFSALTDADWLSTEHHFDRGTFDKRLTPVLPVDEMLKKLEMEISAKPKDGEINRLRNNALNQVMQKASMPCGFYSLTLPTGMGKTLASVAWALKHSKENKLKRIIIVLPYINIIDQTAEILRSIFGEEWVLEHHSNIIEDSELVSDENDNSTDLIKKKRLASENWNYPIIVTTTVQFFESLFSNKPSRCRKIHNVSESVVIFDEVQTFPKEVILPTLKMLKDVQRIMNTSFLFCTATMPAFEKREGFEGIDSIYPLIDNPDELYKKTRRVRYHLLNDLEPIVMLVLLDTVLTEKTSTLVVFNTKKAALKFFNSIKESQNRERIYHLSTAMCPHHRKQVIRAIREDLADERKILVVSTQLIEAGVDFDFPVVFRAMAPLESIIQAAGRCNRENRLGASGGKVFLFDLRDGGMPDKTYAACSRHAIEFIGTDIDQLYDYGVFKKYYTQILNLYVTPDKYNIAQAREDFNFQTVNDSYRIIENATQGLFAYFYSEESKNLFHSIEHKEFLSKEDYRKMQPFTVQVYRDFIFKNPETCKLMPQGFMVWYGGYDRETGVSVNPVDTENLII